MVAQGVSPGGENPTCVPSPLRVPPPLAAERGEGRGEPASCPSCPRADTLGYQIPPRWGLKAYLELTFI
ncbi:hypothetical protein U27_00664 [Candidatus Vecturithrix granuli]|uniref:Uncharacterized protein n=1 Tax=Vecturithrix granuli TaxID=1499967 RepID=A0A081C861_VECG1|nr:hypothetical protein U27_00664 [Candidatus Vecturithrix granuli]